MTTRRFALALFGPIVVSLVFGCENARELVQPTPPPPPPPPASPNLLEYFLAGFVRNTSFRSLAGARVEVVGGPRAGTSVMTDSDGDFTLPGTFAGDTTLVASKDGYRSQTQTIRGDRFRTAVGPVDAWAAFYLELPGPGANITGTYTLQLIADEACTNLPVQTRVRTYTASIGPGERPGFFLARLSDARFLEQTACPDPGCPTWTLNRFSIGVANDAIGIPMSIVEVSDGTTYLLVDASGIGSIEPSGMTASLEGSFAYCPSRPELVDQGTHMCLDVAGVFCDARNHRLTLVRR